MAEQGVSTAGASQAEQGPFVEYVERQGQPECLRIESLPQSVAVQAAIFATRGYMK